jgi:GWxTD domain-containing protein
MRVEAHRDGRSFERKIPFEMDETRLTLAADFDDLVEMVGYIGKRSEITALEDAAPVEREKAWEEFWQKRDPSPGTPENESREEFFSRIQYANATFGSPGTPGWKSDRGMIFIRLGAPDQIDSRPMNPTDPPHEIWHYYAQNRVYIFADLNGFGHYVLVRTERESGR